MTLQAEVSRIEVKEAARQRPPCESGIRSDRRWRRESSAALRPRVRQRAVVLADRRDAAGKELFCCIAAALAVAAHQYGDVAGARCSLPPPVRRRSPVLRRRTISAATPATIRSVVISLLAALSAGRSTNQNCKGGPGHPSLLGVRHSVHSRRRRDKESLRKERILPRKEPADRIDQGQGGAVIDAEGEVMLDLANSSEIGEDIGAAKGVDRLFRIADEEEECGCCPGRVPKIAY